MSPREGFNLEFSTEKELLRNIDIIDQVLKRGNTVRVKYLDKEDIKNLRWKNYDDIHNTIRWDIDNYILMFYKKSNRYLIYKICNLPNDNIQTIFNGTINNKSELQILMKQIGINE